MRRLGGGQRTRGWALEAMASAAEQRLGLATARRTEEKAVTALGTASVLVGVLVVILELD